MIVIALALLAEAASPGGSPRKALSDCLNALVEPAASARTKPPEFMDQAKQKCAAQETAFLNSLVLENKGVGMKSPAAETDAKDQVQELYDRVKDKYQDWYDTKAKG